MTILYYIHDPMCSWCWAFAPTWEKIQQQIPEKISIKYVLGGLAPDNDEPMPKALQNQIAAYWKTIEKKVPGTRFNHDFWNECSPKRSTYPACRAVIATKKQKSSAENKMINAIQTAYYLNAQNPSDLDTLISLANTLGLNVEQFKADINSEETRNQLLQEIGFSQQIGARGFPSLVLEQNNQHYFIPINYNDKTAVLMAIEKYSTKSA